MNATFSCSQQTNRVILSPLVFQWCFKSNFTNSWLLCNPTWREQTFTSETGLHSLVSSSFAGFSICYELFLTFHGKRNLHSFNFKLHSYQLIEIQVIFLSDKKDTHNIKQIKIDYAHQAINHILIQESNDKEVDRNLTFYERAPNVTSLLLEQYNDTI